MGMSPTIKGPPMIDPFGGPPMIDPIGSHEPVAGQGGADPWGMEECMPLPGLDPLGLTYPVVDPTRSKRLGPSHDPWSFAPNIEPLGVFPTIDPWSAFPHIDPPWNGFPTSDPWESQRKWPPVIDPNGHAIIGAGDPNGFAPPSITPIGVKKGPAQPGLFFTHIQGAEGGRRKNGPASHAVDNMNR